MKHEHYEILISREIDNDLNYEEKYALETHLKKCKKCLKLKKDMQKLSSFLNCTENISNVEIIKKPFTKVIFPYIASVAAVFLMVIFSYSMFFQDNEKSQYLATSSTSIEEIANNDIETYSDTSTVDANTLENYFTYINTEDYETSNYDENDHIYTVMTSYYSYIVN